MGWDSLCEPLSLKADAMRPPVLYSLRQVIPQSTSVQVFPVDSFMIGDTDPKPHSFNMPASTCRFAEASSTIRTPVVTFPSFWPRMGAHLSAA